jgi:hypothetical protein
MVVTDRMLPSGDRNQSPRPHTALLDSAWSQLQGEDTGPGVVERTGYAEIVSVGGVGPGLYRLAEMSEAKSGGD